MTAWSLSTLEGIHRVTELALLSGADSVPTQPSVSRLVRVEPLRAESSPVSSQGSTAMVKPPELPYHP